MKKLGLYLTDKAKIVSKVADAGFERFFEREI
jgi:hypothetical protein